jgi:hypothetical protein
MKTLLKTATINFNPKLLYKLLLLGEKVFWSPTVTSLGIFQVLFAALNMQNEASLHCCVFFSGICLRNDSLFLKFLKGE